eukprot:gene8440-9341_t
MCCCAFAGMGSALKRGIARRVREILSLRETAIKSMNAIQHSTEDKRTSAASIKKLKLGRTISKRFYLQPFARYAQSEIKMKLWILLLVCVALCHQGVLSANIPEDVTSEEENEPREDDRQMEDDKQMEDDENDDENDDDAESDLAENPSDEDEEKLAKRRIEGKRSRGRQRLTFWKSLSAWSKVSELEMLKSTRDREKWRSMIAHVLAGYGTKRERERRDNDSGAGVSIIDKRSLHRLKGSATISNLDENLIDASGNKMDIVGKVCIKVLIKGSRRPVFHEFRVVNTNMCTNILLGRDFLKRFRSVTFDFKTNRVKLGSMWFSGLELTTPQRVRLPEKTIIPARTEQTVIVKCSPKTAFLVDYILVELLVPTELMPA